ncbi:MAG: DUF1553 domain-containing protein [Pirellulaceae bacterium]|nr:DUF1553 domain-containing protein [Pirellulaceae bacterium]
MTRKSKWLAVLSPKVKRTNPQWLIWAAIATVYSLWSAVGCLSSSIAREDVVSDSDDTTLEDAPAAADRISFERHVQPILAKSGCNSGACHGALSGKGGFRLSLRGYDAAADHFSITQGLRGRRIELSDPGRSLFLSKPSGAVPHQGGLRLAVDSTDYQIMSQWIAEGATGPRADTALLSSLQVTPDSSRWLPGQEVQLQVKAHYGDGSVADVTPWAIFSSTDEAIAGVDQTGKAVIRGSGEGAVLVWFDSQVRLARLTVPFPHQLPAEVYANSPRRNFIDELNLQQLESLQLRPSPRCDDESFLRRATLDTLGRLPTAAENAAYLANPEATRRDQLIEALLADPSFVDYWTYRWSDLLLINGTRLRPEAVKAYYHWIRNQVENNLPWNDFVAQVVTSSGTSFENGATNFYALHQSPEDMTENVSQAFMGLSIGCARCHNHPLEKWTNDQYYSMANMFSRVRTKGWGGEPRNGDGLRTLFVAAEGELMQPKKGRPQPPAPLDGQPMEFSDPTDRREVLAAWLTDPQNPYFARAIANRVWANFFGRGLVEAVDDLRLSNPASNEALLGATAQYLVEQQFDLKKLMRTILQSETYQRSSQPLPENRDDSKYLSRYLPRRLMAEVLLDSIDQVLGTSTSFKEIAFPGADRQAIDFYPEGTKAIQLYDTAIASTFLKAFGRHNREITCDCERSDQPSMVQVLHLSNGDTLNPKLAKVGNWIEQGMQQGWDNATLIDQIFQVALLRKPTETERQRLLAVAAEYPEAERRQALEDVVWSVLTSTEFTFNH